MEYNMQSSPQKLFVGREFLMHKKALLALMLVVAMMLSGCALIEKDANVDRATEIIKVADTVYTKGEILDQIDYQLNYMAYMYSMFGMSYDPTDPAIIEQTTEDVIDYLVRDAVMNKKVKELGLDALTEEEQAQLDEAVADSWQSNLDTCQSTYFADTELTGDELTAALEAKLTELGFSKDDVVENEKIVITQDKLREYIIKDVAVSDEELQAAFDEEVAAAKETYATDLSSYGTSVNNGSTVYYRPAGYRMTKQILVQFNEADQAVIDELESKVNSQNTIVSNLYVSLSDMGVTDTVTLLENVHVNLEEAQGISTLATVTDVQAEFPKDTTEEVAQAGQQLAEALEVLDFYQAQLKAAKAAAYAAIAPEADEILAQLAEGADWDALMAEKTDDPGMQGDSDTAKNGYAVCENFSSFDTAYTKAAMALENVGDVTDKVEGSYGYYIIQYTSDVAEGPVALDDVRDELSNTTLTTKQDTVYEDTLSQWVTEANAQIDRKALED